MSVEIASRCRWTGCHLYDSCLASVVELNWKGWSCEGCIRFDEWRNGLAEQEAAYMAGLDARDGGRAGGGVVFSGPTVYRPVRARRR